MGRDFRVIPSTLVQEQVLRNNLGKTFLPADEIERSVDAWNGMPVVIRHPMMRGAPVSARTPSVLNERGVGYLYTAGFETGALKADVYVELARIADVPDATAVVNVDGEAAESAELSTGFLANIEERVGKHAGADYELVLHDLRPDHLALLPDELGACSVADGCGLGVNSSVEPVAPRIGDRLLAMVRKLVGAQNESDEDKRMRLWDALVGSFAGANRSLWIDSVFSAESEVVFHLETLSGGQLLRVGFAEAEDGGITFTEPVEVRRVTKFEPVANDAGVHAQQEHFMNRQQMIAHLVANGRTEAQVSALSDCDLQALCNATRPATAAAPAAAANGTVTVPATTQPGDGWAMYQQEREARERLEAQTANARAAEATERERLLADVLYVRNRAWSDAEVQAMGIVELRKLHRTICVDARRSYGGQAFPAGQGATAFNGDFVRGVMDGHEGQSVLDRPVAGGGN